VTGLWFSSGTPVSSTNKTDHYDITEILLKVALNTINQVVLSQPNSFHANRAEEFRKHFTEQLDSIDKVSTCNQ
jgi:hypothetical protein